MNKAHVTILLLGAIVAPLGSCFVAQLKPIASRDLLWLAGGSLGEYLIGVAIGLACFPRLKPETPFMVKVVRMLPWFALWVLTDLVYMKLAGAMVESPRDVPIYVPALGFALSSVLLEQQSKKDAV